MSETKKQPRTIRVRTLLVAFAAIVTVTVVLTLWNFDFLRDQLRAFALGNSELAALKYGKELPRDIDRIELFEIVEGDKAQSQVRFRVYGKPETIFLGSRTQLTSAAAREFTDNWRRMDFGWGYSAMCHYPAFFVRLSTREEVFLETTLCFECSNFITPTPLGNQFLGFDGRCKAGRNLLERFKEIFPNSTHWNETKTPKRGSSK